MADEVILGVVDGVALGVKLGVALGVKLGILKVGAFVLALFSSDIDIDGSFKLASKSSTLPSTASLRCRCSMNSSILTLG